MCGYYSNIFQTILNTLGITSNHFLECEKQQQTHPFINRSDNHAK
jgi:uncharacterized membrane protein